MTEPDHSSQPTLPLRANLAAQLPLAIVWIAALTPVALYLLHRTNAQLTVELAVQLQQIGQQVLVVTGVAAVLGLLLYPPFPAWLRRFVDRTKTSWSVDRTPLLKALSELKHLETAQKHYEVAKLAWIRTDYALAGPHAGRAAQLDPSMPQAHYLFGQFLLRIGALPNALVAFQNAETLDPGHAFGDAQLHIARVQHLLGDDEASLAAFRDYHQSHGDNHRSNYWLGETLLASGDRDNAREAFQKAAIDPTMRLTAEENWFRALARVKCWRLGSSTAGGRA